MVYNYILIFDLKKLLFSFMPHTDNSECHIRNRHQQTRGQKTCLRKIVASKTKSRVRRKLECLPQANLYD